MAQVTRRAHTRQLEADDVVGAVLAHATLEGALRQLSHVALWGLEERLRLRWHRQRDPLGRTAVVLGAVWHEEQRRARLLAGGLE